MAAQCEYIYETRGVVGCKKTINYSRKEFRYVLDKNRIEYGGTYNINECAKTLKFTTLVVKLQYAIVSVVGY